MSQQPEYPIREEPTRHWIIYTNAGYFLVKAQESAVWERQRAYIQQRISAGDRLDQIVFNYQPVTVGVLNAIS